MFDNNEFYCKIFGNNDKNLKSGIIIKDYQFFFKIIIKEVDF